MQIKYPVALDLKNQKIVPISDVSDGIKPNLICPDCKSSFIAVQNHKTPHFKHKSNIVCTGSKETYIHWLSKEIFKTLKEIQLPQILIKDLPEKPRQQFQYKYNKVIDGNIPENFRTKFVKGLKKNLNDSKNILIDTVEIEKEFQTDLGNIRVDVVAKIKNKLLFIEPFVTNKLDVNKKKKLLLIKTPTLSIDLNKFIDSNGFYTSSELREYLISITGKKWIYLKEDTYNRYIGKYIEYLKTEIKNSRELIKQHQIQIDKILSLENTCKGHEDKIGVLRKELHDFRKEISELRKETGFFN